jgi:hypothetical protein
VENPAGFSIRAALSTALAVLQARCSTLRMLC